MTPWGQRREGGCEKCGEPILAKRLCSKHYNRMWRDTEAKAERRNKGVGGLMCGLCSKPLAKHTIAGGCPK